MKNIASELRPGVLGELGLVGIGCRVCPSNSLASDFNVLGFKTNTAKAKFDRSAAVAIFRIVQAALTNVARHAHASRARITLMRKKNGLILTVMDNGKGITRKPIHSHDSLGITGMRERALAFGGTFTLGGSRSKGTTLTVQIPLARAISGTAP